MVRRGWVTVRTGLGDGRGSSVMIRIGLGDGQDSAG